MLEQRIDRWTQDWKHQGRQEGEAGVVLHLLERKHGPLPTWVRERVSSADAEQLLVWADRILTASSLDEIFSD